MANKSFTRLVLLFVIVITTSHAAHAQANDSATQTPQLKEYVFHAQSFSCQSISMRPLVPGEYEVRITPDSVLVSLPYYGRYFSGSQNASGIRFSSARFDRTISQKKKGKLYITIRPNDTREVQQLFFTVLSDASAILQVNSTNREPMSFTGYITGK